MASLNKVQIIGYLGKDPEVKQFSNGNMCKLSVSTDESYTDRSGNRVERSEWHIVIVNGKQSDFCENYLHKGSQVYVEGRLATRKYNADGQDRYVTEIKCDRIQLLDRKPSGQQNNNRTNQQVSQQFEPAFPSDASQMQDAPF